MEDELGKNQFLNTQNESRTFHQLQLSGNWDVYPISLHADVLSSQPSELISVPETAHLQPVLYPEAPFWGDHLRAINQQAWIYRRTFTLPDVPFQRARIRFEGVDHFADVWLNGQYLGNHEGHFAPFEFDITAVVSAENSLLVRVASPWDSPNPSGSYPTDHVIRGLVKGLYEHGEGVIPPNVNPIGIWRPVRLLLDQGISLDHTRIRTGLDGRIELHVRLTNATDVSWSGKLLLEVTPENHDGKGVTSTVAIDLLPGTSSIDHIVTIPEPQLWWSWDQGDPALYRLTAALRDSESFIVSKQTEIFGIRTIELERSPERFTYRLNGRPVFIRGSAYIPALYLSQCDNESLKRDLNLAHQANLNLLRVHTHVSPPELYELCDRMGMLIWQDFELNWIYDPSQDFEARARVLQKEMIDLLGNHPSVMTWACYNEPTMIFTRRDNLETRPAPALYADAIQQDPTRPVFICSGQLESDWLRAGDAHTYYGALWTEKYTDIYKHRFRLNTEFGFEAPADLTTLQSHPFCWERLKHLEDQIDDLWEYQAQLIQFHVEHLRRLRAEGNAGFIHFWLVDLVPQVGCGVLDVNRLPKEGYEALRRASQPLHIALEHDGHHPIRLWVFNDSPQAYMAAIISWKVDDPTEQCLLEGQTTVDIPANTSTSVLSVDWSLPGASYGNIELSLHTSDGVLLDSTMVHNPFNPMRRPRGYPWKFDPVLGVKVFNHPQAASLADQSKNRLITWVPLGTREKIAEWALRQQLPPRLLSMIAHLSKILMGE